MSSKELCALAVASLALFQSHDARAQGCCASGSSLTPIRLDLHERALAGLQLGLNVQHGSFDDAASYRVIPDGVSDVELRQTAFATIAPLPRLQVSALVPWLSTRRAAGTTNEWGTGIGDVNFAARFEPLQLHESTSAPAIAVIGTVMAPTGTSPEDATNTLGSDATGAGTWRLGGGFALERDYDAFLFNLTVVASTALPRRAGELRFTYAPRFDFTLGAGYAASHHWHLAAVFTYEREGAPKIAGQPGLSRSRFDTSLLVTHLLDDDIRLQAAVTATPPVSTLGRNDIARVGGTLSLVWSWL